MSEQQGDSILVVTIERRPRSHFVIAWVTLLCGMLFIASIVDRFVTPVPLFSMIPDSAFVFLDLAVGYTTLVFVGVWMTVRLGTWHIDNCRVRFVSPRGKVRMLHWEDMDRVTVGYRFVHFADRHPLRPRLSVPPIRRDALSEEVCEELETFLNRVVDPQILNPPRKPLWPEGRHARFVWALKLMMISIAITAALIGTSLLRN